MATDLTFEQRRVLRVLGYMLFRMGLDVRARRVYAALASTEPPDSPDVNAHAALAAIAIREGDGAEALRQLKPAVDAAPPSSVNASLMFMKAQAFWIQGRVDEARNAVDEYLYLTGGGTRA